MVVNWGYTRGILMTMESRYLLAAAFLEYSRV